MEYMIFSALSYDNATEIFERLLLMLKSFTLCVSAVIYRGHACNASEYGEEIVLVLISEFKSDLLY